MADPQKLMRTTKTYMTDAELRVPSRYKTPRPYSAEPVVTFRSNVPGSPTKGSNGNNRPPVSVNNRRVPGKDYDKRTRRTLSRQPAAAPGPAWDGRI